MTKPTVELHNAWFWTCDECGRDNYCRSVTADLTGMTEAEIRTMALVLGIIDVHETEVPEGCFCTQPETVKCAHCGALFATKDTRDP